MSGGGVFEQMERYRDAFLEQLRGQAQALQRLGAQTGDLDRVIGEIEDEIAEEARVRKESSERFVGRFEPDCPPTPKS